MGYKEELFAQKAPYLQWLAKQEKAFARKYENWTPQREGAVYRLPFSSCLDSVADVLPAQKAPNCDTIYLFVKEGGILSPYAEAAMLEVFQEHDKAVLVYADEDCQGSVWELYDMDGMEFDQEVTKLYHFGAGENFRGKPWFKPDFSPDTLSAFFYIGSIFAVRGDRLCSAVSQYGKDSSLYVLIYNMLMEVVKRCPEDITQMIYHLPAVLYTDSSPQAWDILPGMGAMQQKLPDKDYGKVSVIIPSKDHERVLANCIHSLLKYTNYRNFELIIVDNGSSGEQQQIIQELLENIRLEYPQTAVQYLYQEMAFNFSSMCNIGKNAATGAFLLFLNDDIEVLGTKEGSLWLDHMLRYAVQPHVGAVGAKLYYPKEGESYRIQHAGITNMGIGPAHKLAGMEDKGSLYYGHNLVSYNMIAVTAACMLIRREVLESAKGFDECLAVAYNDVELCFRLYEAGYYNVQVNDAVLIHHESLSRGQDTDPEKTQRLEREKQLLYEKHPLLKGCDPFYSPNLVQWKKDTDYSVCFEFAFEKSVSLKALSAVQSRAMRRRYHIWKSAVTANKAGVRGIVSKICLKLGGYSRSMYQIDSAVCEGKQAVIRGWYVLKGMDNTVLDKTLWLLSETTAYVCTVQPQYRADVTALFDGGGQTTNTALAGIYVLTDTTQMEKGNYVLGISVCLGRKVYAAFSEITLEIR